MADWNDRAREDRRELLEADVPGRPLHELRLTVPNRPGIVAQVALELGRAGVNIVDMALAPAADMRSGAMTLWVAGDQDAARARELIGGLGFPVGEEDGHRSLRAFRRAPRSHPAGRQVDLAPGGALRRDVRRAADRPQLPGLGRHPLDTRRRLTLGAGVQEDEDHGRLLIRGVGLHAPLEATGGLLNVGNAGTLIRLLPGWLAGQPGSLDARRRRIDLGGALWTAWWSR